MNGRELYDANPFAAPESKLDEAIDSPQTGHFRYAGFCRRFIAAMIDYYVVMTPCFLMMLIFFPRELASREAPPIQLFLGIPIGWLYYSLLESSTLQATFGKRWLGLRVVDLNGGRISFPQATGRYFSKAISGLIFGIVFFQQLFTRRRQCLHDLMSGCLVVFK